MFDFKKFLTTEVGSVGNCVALFDGYGLKSPGRSAVEKWFQRGQVASPWFAAILALLELENGRPITLGRYLQWRKP